MQPGDEVQYKRSACDELGGFTRERAEAARGTIVYISGDNTSAYVTWTDGRVGWIGQKYLEKLADAARGGLMDLLEIKVEYDAPLDRLVFSACDPPFERRVYLHRGEPWDNAVELIQEAWRRWRRQ